VAHGLVQEPTGTWLLRPIAHERVLLPCSPGVLKSPPCFLSLVDSDQALHGGCELEQGLALALSRQRVWAQVHMLSSVDDTHEVDSACLAA
jgi:hypothetical protein